MGLSYASVGMCSDSSAGATLAAFAVMAAEECEGNSARLQSRERGPGSRERTGPQLREKADRSDVRSSHSHSKVPTSPVLVAHSSQLSSVSPSLTISHQHSQQSHHLTITTTNTPLSPPHSADHSLGSLLYSWQHLFDKARCVYNASRAILRVSSYLQGRLCNTVRFTSPSCCLVSSAPPT